MSNFVISVGWPKPKNLKILERTRGLNKEIEVRWDNININESPFTVDPNGNAASNIKYRVTQKYVVVERKYDVEGNFEIVENVSGETQFDVFTNSFKQILSEGVDTKICFEVQAVYNYSDSPVKNTLPIISGKSKMVCHKLPIDFYCLKQRCKIGTVLSKEKGSSKFRYAQAINNARASSSFFSNYGRGFMNLGLGTSGTQTQNRARRSRNCN